nr:EOG090X0IS7 [Eulimnadia texana]
MPVIHGNNRERDDSDREDHEEMDHDKHGGHSDKEGSMASDSSPGSDSEDSSEMDEEECEHRRTECLDTMSDLERQFLLLKEQLFRERMMQVEKKLADITAGRGNEYLVPLADLQEALRVRSHVASVLHQYKLENIQNKFEAEGVAALQDFESRKSLLKDSIRESLNEKIRRLEEERHQVDFMEYDENKRKNRGLQRYSPTFEREDPKEKRKKPVTVSGPYIVYMLSESDITEDWNLIRKALTSVKRKDCNIQKHLLEVN